MERTLPFNASNKRWPIDRGPSFGTWLSDPFPADHRSRGHSTLTAHRALGHELMSKLVEPTDWSDMNVKTGL